MFERIAEELRSFAPGGGWVLTGSAAMAVCGIPVEPGDVDMFMRPWVYEKALVRRGGRETSPAPNAPPMLVWEGGELPVSAWWRWRHRARWRLREPTVEEVFAGAS